MIVTHELIKVQKKSGKSHHQADVDIFPLAEELYWELDKLGFIEKMKQTPQLGTVRVDKKMSKSRYDYIMLQIHFHWLVKKNLPNLLRLTYNNYVRPREFNSDLTWNNRKTKVTIADLIQILTIASNIGHFFNTFVASRAVMVFAQENPEFKTWIIEQSCDPHYQECARKILCKGGYKRFHLLNALLVLEHCDPLKLSVQLAKGLIYAYINQDSLEEDSKLHYVFWLFRTVRNVAFIAYDLQVSQLPLVMDLSNSDALLLLLKEHLSEYDNGHSTEELLHSLGKMLDATVYNKEPWVICHYAITQKMVRQLRQDKSWIDKELYTYLRESDSLFNRKYSLIRDYVEDGLLKLTFSRSERDFRLRLFAVLDRMQGVRVGYYDRNSGEQTIVVSISMKNPNKVQTAFKVMQVVVSHLRRIPGMDKADPRYLLAAKFFLFYMVDRNPIIIKPTIHDSFCVTCAKGVKQNRFLIQSMIKMSRADEDQIHEAEFLCKAMERQGDRDLCIAICSSIQVFDQNKLAKCLCEFDGMLFFPNRKSGQIVFLEAKNTRYEPSYGRNCLIEKLEKLRIPYEEENIKLDGHDAYYIYNVQDLVRKKTSY